MTMLVTVEDGEPARVQLTRRVGPSLIWIDDHQHACSMTPAGDGYVVTVDNESAHVAVAAAGDEVFVHAFGRQWVVTVAARTAGSGRSDADTSIAPMPGVVVGIHTSEGARVNAGDLLMTIESMKMQTQITASRSGTVERIHLQFGDSFDRGTTLLTLQHEDEE